VRLLRRLTLAFAAAALSAGIARAQGAAPDTSHTLPWDVAGEVAYRYNLPSAVRARGNATIAAGRVVDGNVAVRDGALVVEGVVHGSVIVINGSLDLRASARVDSEVVVVGGAFKRADSAQIGGKVSVYPQMLTYRMAGDAIIAVHDSASVEGNWFKRWQTRYDSAGTRFALRAGTFDRVEGLPVEVGLDLRRNLSIGHFSLLALGIYRSVNSFAWTSANLGYDVTAELKGGREHGTAYGVRFYDLVAPVESWELSNSEVSLYSFSVRNDMRDYYNAQGASTWGSLLRGNSTYTLKYTQDWWALRTAQNPVSLFHTSNPWRDNPELDQGLLRRVNATYQYDSRNNDTDPWVGWLIDVDGEVGWTESLTEGPTSTIARPTGGAPASLTYGRGWLDLRRYNRVSPMGHLNLRLVFGTPIGGGELPLERRFSMGGPGSLPGYEFRQLLSPDVFTCSDSTVPAGQPAQCSRMMLAQIEYRGDFTLRLFPREAKPGEARSYRVAKPMSWVVFTDAGRGWVTGPTADGVSYGTWTLPPLYTFRADMGAGVDVNWLGLYVAKSLTDWQTPVQFVVRLQHRF
jgi:cytoskeletal protein CcmA (bactofilin family)